MAYPIQLFDFQSDEGRKAGTEFLQSFDANLTSLFGINTATDNQRDFHEWQAGKVPKYLTALATKSMQKIMKQLPEGEMKWKGSVGIYGRKRGSIIKRGMNILYRMVINLGNIEIYYLDDEGFRRPVVLANGYALLCSSVTIEKMDIKVQSDPIRRNLPSNIKSIVPKIRSRKYLRSTIVLDLLMDGLTFANSEK